MSADRDTAGGGSAAPVHVIGASGRSGRAICAALAAQGTPVVAVVRNAARLAANGPGTGSAGAGAPVAQVRVADLTGPQAALQAALADASRIICTAHARHIPAVLKAAPAHARLIGLGSTRKFTRWPDAHGNGVLLGERALLESGRPGAILHPSMIYGAQGENNVQRLAALLRWLPVVPLPGGGRALVQPIWQGDVTACVLAALNAPWSGPRSIVIAGRDAVSYKQFVTLVGQAAGLRPRPFVSLPVALLQLAARVTPFIPFLPRIGADEIRRLMEDKAFDIAPMRESLGITPIGLEDGLARTFQSR
ncbi:NAD(P)H-binding protein [Acetobacter sp. TBRC 12305]|uniref:NAD(P)H-binding protein n=1 Tax=Acetobacter garciniae TaxID=2817435 RepID=A0A939HN50_9PROT|nr:NAD(P)H-binding protein [Acetobacter garciniae]MBX0344414.1 NAD(P)H-binding protein [Acetobacter garciniae]